MSTAGWAGAGRHWGGRRGCPVARGALAGVVVIVGAAGRAAVGVACAVVNAARGRGAGGSGMARVLAQSPLAMRTVVWCQPLEQTDEDAVQGLGA